jgi:antitoxin (DNA-binding transcriptional repressor) of toxin-antitoxin stability system
MGIVRTNIADVKAKLSEYLDRAQAGERIVICRHNTPVAELRALEQGRLEPRPVGPLPGRPTFTIAQSFFDALPEDELGLWESDRDVGQLVPAASGTVRVAERKATFKAPSKRSPRRRQS